MGVKGEIDRAVKVQYRFHNSGLDCLRLRAAESAGNEIVLHVHNDQYVHAMIGLRFVLGWKGFLRFGAKPDCLLCQPDRGLTLRGVLPVPGRRDAA